MWALTMMILCPGIPAFSWGLRWEILVLVQCLKANLDSAYQKISTEHPCLSSILGEKNRLTSLLWYKDSLDLRSMSLRNNFPCTFLRLVRSRLNLSDLDDLGQEVFD